MRRISHILCLVVLGTGGILKGQPAALSLSEAIRAALENNYGITIAEADVSAASLNNNWGTAGRYPTIGFDAAFNNSYDLADYSTSNQLSAGLGLNWTLFDGFRVNITKSVLENREDLSAGILGVIVENTIEDIVLGYYGVLLEKERLGVLEHVMQLSRDRYDYEQKRKELGSAVTYQVLQAENVYLSDKAAWLEQQVRVRNAMRNFNFILAADPGKSWTLSESFTADTAHFNLSDLHAKMIGNNQALKNQYTNLLLSLDETRLREAAFSPAVSAAAGIDNRFTRIGAEGDAIRTRSYAPYGNVRLTFDIYKGGVRKRELQIARINEETAQVEIEQMEHALTNELYNLYDYYEVRIALLGVADKSLASAELNLRLSEEKYRSGVINSFNYRDVQMIFLEASLRRIQAIYNLIDSRARLTRITGGYLQTEE